MKEKAKDRKKGIDISKSKDVLDQLDLKDYIEIIASNPYEYRINNDKSKLLEKYFEKIIPVRNRVMHTKPLEIGDRALLIEVIERINDDINWISWEEVLETKRKLESSPSELLAHTYEKKAEYNPKVYNNLPEPEFDDTGYIGRVKEQKEIKELILDLEKNQIINIFNDVDMNIKDIIIQKNPLMKNAINGVYFKKEFSFGKEKTLNAFLESSGTLKFLSLISHLLYGIKNGSLFIVDELDSGLHTKLLRYMMKKKTFAIINICVVLLFAIYLVTALFIDYSKYVNIIILSVYFLYGTL